jgi:menaquinone-dependent protoporphyrinogen oxidase
MTRKVLVACASRHGSTMDIADAIAGVLSARGCDVTDKEVDEVASVDGFDAAVIGSAVYVGRWMSDAVSFIEDNAAGLSRIPVWLFSSGPLGDPPKPEGDPTTIAELLTKITPRGHRVFKGRLDTGLLGLGEKVIVGMVKAPKGDFRDFGEIEAWAREIADELAAEPVAQLEAAAPRS